MMVMYAVLVALIAAVELMLAQRITPQIRQTQSKLVASLFFWIGIVPGLLVEAFVIILFIRSGKLGTPPQVLAVTVVALAVGLVGGRILLRASRRKGGGLAQS